jgi:hypothetical protein
MYDEIGIQYYTDSINRTYLINPITDVSLLLIA